MDLRRGCLRHSRSCPVCRGSGCHMDGLAEGTHRRPSGGNTRQGQLDDRFKTGVELLGHHRSAVRQGGICVLRDIGFMRPDDFHVKVMAIFVSYLTYPPEDRRAGRLVLGGPDIKGIEWTFRYRTATHRAAEREFGFDLDERLEPSVFSFGRGSDANRRYRLIVDEAKRAAREKERLSHQVNWAPFPAVLLTLAQGSPPRQRRQTSN